MDQKYPPKDLFMLKEAWTFLGITPQAIEYKYLYSIYIILAIIANLEMV